MFRRMKASAIVALTITLILSVASPSLAVQKKSKTKEAMPRGTPVLWQEPADIASRDLYVGPGGEAMRPDLSRITFIKEEKGGFSTKYRVKDGSGREWVAKVGKEAQPETAAVRLLWAVGYHTEINYLAPRVQIIGKGAFENVRFEARPSSVKRLDEWKWSENPFVGTKELQGMIVMMALFNNWDIKDANNKILFVRGDGTGENQLRYIISDLGATFGKTGTLPVFWRVTRSRNNPEDFRDSEFIEDVKNGNVFFRYGGKNQGLFDDIRVEEAQWIGGWLARLSERQISDAFRAANYSPEEVQLLTAEVRARIDELVNLQRMTGRR